VTKVSDGRDLGSVRGLRSSNGTRSGEFGTGGGEGRGGSSGPGGVANAVRGVPEGGVESDMDRRVCMDEWREALAPSSGKKYYYNRRTRESAWR